MKTTAKERLIEFLKYKNIGQNKFERMCGLSLGYISKLRIEPSPTKLRGIINAFPELNEKWLLTGEGNMLNDSDVSGTEMPDVLITEEIKVMPNGAKYLQKDDGKILMEVPVVPIAALGSPEDEFATINKDYEDEKLHFVVDGVHHGNYYAFYVQGDSMDDGTRESFEAGDSVLVRELPRDEWPPKLRIKKWPFWVVCWDNNVRIKQIISQDEETGDITLHSLNPSPEYCDFTIPLSRISRLFNVIQRVPKAKTY